MLKKKSSLPFKKKKKASSISHSKWKKQEVSSYPSSMSQPITWEACKIISARTPPPQAN